MTSNVELLPLPEEEAIGWTQAWSYDQMRDYARANVLHNTAPLRYALDNAARSIKTLREVRDAQAAEIEALWAELEVICAEAVKYADKSGRLEAKVDRLAEAGRRVTAAFRAHGEASAMLSLADAIEAASG